MTARSTRRGMAGRPLAGRPLTGRPLAGLAFALVAVLLPAVAAALPPVLPPLPTRPTRPVQPGHAPGQAPGRMPVQNPQAATSKARMTFPDGMQHDFGVIWDHEKATHKFEFVNRRRRKLRHHQRHLDLRLHGSEHRRHRRQRPPHVCPRRPRLHRGHLQPQKPHRPADQTRPRFPQRRPGPAVHPADPVGRRAGRPRGPPRDLLPRHRTLRAAPHARVRGRRPRGRL